MASSRTNNNSNNPPIAGSAASRAMLNNSSRAFSTASARRGLHQHNSSLAANTSVSSTSTLLGKRSSATALGGGGGGAGEGSATSRRRLAGAASSSSLNPSMSSASLMGGGGGGNNYAASSGAASASQQQPSSSSQESSGSSSSPSNANIQVAVRVRGRAGAAPSAPRPPDSCVFTEGPRSNTITISADPLNLSSSVGGGVAGLLPFASPIKKSAKGAAAGSRNGAGAEGGASGSQEGSGGAAQGGAGSGSSVQPYKKTYNFDHVFGPEADQGMVYSDVVAPILKEVLEGYNCTIFAYGQTGTGKTHTMEGDLSPHPSTGTFATDAGIIPRTLFRLFHILETSGAEYSVRASFVELYNEELRDLLAVEDAGAEDGGAAGPGSGSASGASGAAGAQRGNGKGKDTASSSASFGSAGANGGMRMYDDAKGRGVVIQGLEEVPITSAEAGLEILRRGSAKRHIAATNCNSQSSRSHSVFSLTIHHTTTNNLSGSQSGPPCGGPSGAGNAPAGARPILLGKDGKPLPGQAGSGEDVMRIGKLNLVDLAGSENIGRSGAADKRAREAGMINQSLLTLGRVINALVEKQSHIPFRESKLTRLLQESLGGRTKTCIIATVSESKGSIDETLSTLDYATRARSIQNRPEMNARTTRAALLSEYIAENLRLRADLKATRSKNGVFLSQETLETMEGNHARAVREAQASKLECDLAASRIQTMQEQLEQNSAVLGRKEEEARHAKAEWEKAKAECARLGAELAASRKAEGEEIKLREAYMRSEQRVNGVAEGLRGVLQQSTDEVELLLGKLARKSDVEQKNRELMADCNNVIRDLVGKLEDQVADFRNTHERFSNGLADSLVAFATAQESAKEESLDNVGDAFKAVQEALADVREGHTVTYERAQELATQVGKVRESVSTLFKGRSKLLQGYLNAFFTDVRARQTQFEEAASASLTSLTSQTQEFHKELELIVGAGETHVEAVRKLATELVASERAALASERERIQAAVAAERTRAEGAKRAFLAAVSSAADELVGGGLREFERFGAGLEPALAKRGVEADAFEQAHGAEMTGMAETLGYLAQYGAEAQVAHVGETDALSAEVKAWTGALGKRLGKMEKDEMGAYHQRCTADAEDEDRHLEELNKFVLEDAEVNKEVLDGAANALRAGVNSLNSAAETGIASAATAMQQMANSTATQIQSHRKVGVAFLDANTKGLGKVRSQSKNHLQKRMQEDVATGATPQKHEWRYPTAWSTMPTSRSAAVVHVEEHGTGEDSFGFEYSAGPGSSSSATASMTVLRPASGLDSDESRDVVGASMPQPSQVARVPSDNKVPGSPGIRFPTSEDMDDRLASGSGSGSGSSAPFGSVGMSASPSVSILLTPNRSRRAGRKTSVLADGEILLPGMSPVVGKENLSMVGPSTSLSLRHLVGAKLTMDDEDEELAEAERDMSMLLKSPAARRTRATIAAVEAPVLPSAPSGSTTPPKGPAAGASSSKMSAAAKVVAAVSASGKKTRSTFSRAAGVATSHILGHQSGSGSGSGAGSGMPSSPSNSQMLMNAARNRVSRRTAAVGSTRTPPRSGR